MGTRGFEPQISRSGAVHHTWLDHIPNWFLNGRVRTWTRTSRFRRPLHFQIMLHAPLWYQKGDVFPFWSAATISVVLNGVEPLSLVPKTSMIATTPQDYKWRFGDWTPTCCLIVEFFLASGGVKPPIYSSHQPYESALDGNLTHQKYLIKSFRIYNYQKAHNNYNHAI